MDSAIRKAEALIEALSYIRQFHHRVIVIKLGGSAMEEPETLRATLQDVVFMATVGLRPVLVHGGGKPIDRAMAAAGLKPRKVQGRRYTDEETLAIVVRVLMDEINSDIDAAHSPARAAGRSGHTVERCSTSSVRSCGWRGPRESRSTSAGSARSRGWTSS